MSDTLLTEQHVQVAPEVLEHEVKNIPLKQIEQNENSRVVYKQVELGELMQSMKANGLLQAVGVKKLGPNRYEAVWGNRRIVAAKKLGWHDIPARIIEADTDIDRDILGMIENLKRQNTSLDEDGRMFQSLVDRGLSPQEIAARLSIKVERIEFALNSFQNIPAEYRKKIRHESGPSANRAGVISPKSAKRILDLRRRYNLPKKAVTQLLDFAAQEDVTSSQIDQVAPLLKAGTPLRLALSKAGALHRVNIFVFIDKQNIEKLEKKYAKPITDILWDQIEKNKEIGAIRKLEQDDEGGKKKLKTVARFGAA